MKVGFARQLTYSLAGVLVLAGLGPLRAQAQDHQSHAAASLQYETQEQRNQTSAFVKVVRDATERFKNVARAEAEGYFLQFGCVSGSDAGAMGMHFVNFPLVADGELDPTRPEIVIYEPTSTGRLRLIGADYLVLAEAWDKKHPGAPPQLMGQLFHLFESPNRFGLPPFYTLHVWAWKDNPLGTFTNWNPNVSCDGFNGVSQ